tara:strand:- start:283 stop:483 length:201 start_codon:yes stop_codon:yes gene_type:complete
MYFIIGFSLQQIEQRDENFLFEVVDKYFLNEAFVEMKDETIDACYFDMVNTYGDLDLMIESFNSNG